ncbi:MAG: VOC family protein [Gemmatimonadaceae bacterium]
MAERIGIAPPGFELPDGTHVGRVRLQVTNLDRSMDYYEKVLGFKAAKPVDGVVALNAGTDAAPLLELVEKPGANPVPSRGRLGLYHFALLLPNRAALGRFLGHLQRMGVRAGMSDHLVSEAIYLTDPDGLGIEVYADKARSTWQLTGKQIAVASNPLKVDEVLRAGEGISWDGMPSGTVMGHVHFYVGDVEQASAFYHVALGLSKIVWNYPGALFMSAGGYHHHVGVNTWASGAPVATDDDARLIEWELLVPDAEAVASVAKGMLNAGFGDGATATDGSLIATDPWGIRLRLRPEESISV